MSVLVDTSILIDVLRGVRAAAETLRQARLAGLIHASEVTRLEVLAGMRASEEPPTRALLAILNWHSVDSEIAEIAGELGRQWSRHNRGIDSELWRLLNPETQGTITELQSRVDLLLQQSAQLHAKEDQQ